MEAKELAKLIRDNPYVTLFRDEAESLAEYLLEHGVVKVVRCKNCVSRVEFDTNKFHCELTGYYCGETGYCSDGMEQEGNR